MNLISIENLNKSYGEKILFNNISFSINQGEKIGLIGVNGTGKSTLLKIVAGVDNYYLGNIIKRNNLSIEYLPQNTIFKDDTLVIEQIFKGNSPIMKILREYENFIEKLERDPDNKNFQNKVMELSSKIDALDGWKMESEAKSILTKLGIKNFDVKVGTLSGGQKKRIALASTLINPCDLLILDEPTNHIDNDTVNWLEEYLNNRKGALFIITHDRYFLDRVTNRILELNKGNLYSYNGNYSKFLELKIEREKLMENLERKRQRFLKKELEWIRSGVKARGTKQKARKERFEEIKSKEIDTKSDKLDISTGSSRLGKKVIVINNISKSFKGKKLINDFNCIINRKDRIGIIGDNGSGKTTLLNVITGKLTPDSGSIDIGDTVKIGYFYQEYKEFDESMRAIEYIKEESEFINSDDGKLISASQMMERFLFSPELQWSYISKLSGGERRRLYLLRVLISQPNVLILDEPTNDLDIETLNVLEDYINNFNGVVISVSHDRYFLDKIANKILSFEQGGNIIEYIGNYSNYKEFYENNIKEKYKETKEEIKEDKKSNKQENNKCKTKLKFSYKEKREYELIEGVIEEVEDKLEKVNEKINLSSSDYTLLQELIEKQKELENELENLMERWTYLNELAEKIQLNK